MPTKERREARLKKGLCGTCGQQPHLPDSSNCQSCLNYKKDHHRGGRRERKPRLKLRPSKGRDKEKQKQRQHESYLRNKKQVQERSKQRTLELRLFILQYKKDSGGCSCGEKHPALLDFHHRDPENKIASINRMVAYNRSLEVIQRELKKCDILCANCHRRLHWNGDNPDDLDGYGKLGVSGERHVV